MALVGRWGHDMGNFLRPHTALGSLRALRVHLQWPLLAPGQAAEGGDLRAEGCCTPAVGGDDPDPDHDHENNDGEEDENDDDGDDEEDENDDGAYKMLYSNSVGKLESCG